MRKIKVKEDTVFVSEETYQEYQTRASDLKITLERKIAASVNAFFYHRIHERVAPFFEKWRSRHKGVAILDAHGSRIKGIWYYLDGNEEKTVQSWIDSVDGKYGTLVLLVCDESWLINLPKALKSLLFLPDGIVISGIEPAMDGSLHHFSAIHPTYGEIDGYTAEHAMEHLFAAR